MADSYKPKTFFSFIDCGAECPVCNKDKPLTSTWGLNDPAWFIKSTCVRKSGHPAEAHFCYRCQREW